MKHVIRVHPDFPDEKLRPLLDELRADLNGVEGLSRAATVERDVIRQSIANVQRAIERRGL